MLSNDPKGCCFLRFTIKRHQQIAVWRIIRYIFFFSLLLLMNYLTTSDSTYTVSQLKYFMSFSLGLHFPPSWTHNFPHEVKYVCELSRKYEFPHRRTFTSPRSLSLPIISRLVLNWPGKRRKQTNERKRNEKSKENTPRNATQIYDADDYRL